MNNAVHLAEHFRSLTPVTPPAPANYRGAFAKLRMTALPGFSATSKAPLFKNRLFPIAHAQRFASFLNPKRDSEQ